MTLRDARTARREGQAARAATLFEAYLALRPDDLGVYTEAGWCLWVAGRTADAVALWRDALARDPLPAPPRLALAHAAQAAGDPAGALALAQGVLADHPDHAAAQLTLAEALLALGRTDEAEPAARAAAEAAQADLRARLVLGRALRARGAVEASVEAFKAAARAAPERPMPWIEAVRTLLDAGRAEDALALADDARAALPDEPELRLAQAQALRAQGRRAEAAALLATEPRAAAELAVDRAALARPARFARGGPPDRDEAGATLAQGLAGATAREIELALGAATREAHPFTTVAAARLLLGHLTDPEARLAVTMATADAWRSLTLEARVAATLESFAAERPALPPALEARLHERRAEAVLAVGDRTGAAAIAEQLAALVPGRAAGLALAAVLRHAPDPPPAEACLGLLAGLSPDHRLRPWLAAGAASLIAADDARLGLGAAPWRQTAEMLLRHNVALARGDGAATRSRLAALFARHGLDCPQPEGAPPGHAHFACAAPAPVDGPLVSIVISAFQAEATLGMALRSVLAQSWRNIEVIVVDDASTDGTARIIADAAAGDPRVRPLRQDRNGGTYAARNRAIAAAHGDFVTFHDSDDWMHPRRIETEVAAFARPSLMAVESQSFRMDSGGRATIKPFGVPVYANPSFLMFRAGALRRLGAYDHVRASADMEMSWRARLVFGRDAIATLPQVLMVGSARAGSLTTAPATGFDMFGYSAVRLVYHEAWGSWHMACDAAGAMPLLAADGPRRPYADALPGALLAG
jgi:tetratricopeptide (TPR) repeat protein